MLSFRRETKTGRFLDPRADFAETSIESEVRYDPLTGDTGRICHFAFSSAPPADLDGLVAGTAATCPFCPDKVRKITPRFPADMIEEGRLERGDAVLFPNLFPYDDVSAIAVIANDHFHAMDAMPEKVIADGVGVARDFLRRIAPGTGSKGDPTFGIATWNYMPPAGASQVHPHMQVIQTTHGGNGLRRWLDAAHAYAEGKGRPYIADLLAAEREDGARWVGESGGVSWLVPFVPNGILGDCLAVFPEKATVAELEDRDIADFASGLSRVLAAFARLGLWSFNMVFLPDHSGAGAGKHWLTVRLVPRLYLNPALHVTDVAYLPLILEERFAMTYPEKTAEQLRTALAA